MDLAHLLVTKICLMLEEEDVGASPPLKNLRVVPLGCDKYEGS